MPPALVRIFAADDCLSPPKQSPTGYTAPALQQTAARLRGITPGWHTTVTVELNWNSIDLFPKSCPKRRTTISPLAATAAADSPVRPPEGTSASFCLNWQNVQWPAPARRSWNTIPRGAASKCLVQSLPPWVLSDPGRYGNLLFRLDQGPLRFFNNGFWVMGGSSNRYSCCT